jgi:hypothetical protein
MHENDLSDLENPKIIYFEYFPAQKSHADQKYVGEFCNTSPGHLKITNIKYYNPQKNRRFFGDMFFLN